MSCWPIGEEMPMQSEEEGTNGFLLHFRLSLFSSMHITLEQCTYIIRCCCRWLFCGRCRARAHTCQRETEGGVNKGLGSI